MRPFLGLLGALGTLAVVICAQEALSAKSELLQLTPGIAVEKVVPGAYKLHPYGFVGDPRIADIVFGPNNVFLIVGKNEGLTNVIVLDTQSGDTIYSAQLQVGKGTRIQVRVYSGRPLSDAYICTATTCVPSDVKTVSANAGSK